MKQKRILWLAGLCFILTFPLIFGLVAEPGLDGETVAQLSKLSALLGMILFGLQVVLGAKVKFIEGLFGHDKIIVLHRKLGMIALVLVLFHALTALGTALGRDAAGVMLGVVMLFLFLIMLFFIVAHRLFRMKYEYWRNVHQLNYLIFPGAYLHSLILGSNVRSNSVWQILWLLLGLGFLGVLLYKSGNELRVRRNWFRVARVVREAPHVWTLEFELAEPGRDRVRPFAYLPGQFLILRLVQNGYLREAHPFTISSSPTMERPAVSIKAAGDFTGQIAKVKPGDRALLDAPYGRFSFLNHPAGKYIFIAGGIGITPFMSMLRYMRDQCQSPEILLIWGNRTEQDIAFRAELAALEQAWPNFRAVHILSEEKNWQGESGFITGELLQKYGGDLAKQEIFICGPPIMMQKTIRGLRALRVPRRQIHFEQFSW